MRIYQAKKAIIPLLKKSKKFKRVVDNPLKL